MDRILAQTQGAIPMDWIVRLSVIVAWQFTSHNRLAAGAGTIGKKKHNKLGIVFLLLSKPIFQALLNMVQRQGGVGCNTDTPGT
jgi:hypothetical protein